MKDMKVNKEGKEIQKIEKVKWENKRKIVRLTEVGDD